MSIDLTKNQRIVGRVFLTPDRQRSSYDFLASLASGAFLSKKPKSIVLRRCRRVTRIVRMFNVYFFSVLVSEGKSRLPAQLPLGQRKKSNPKRRLVCGLGFKIFWTKAEVSSLITGRVRGISALGAVVVVRGCYRRADGGCAHGGCTSSRGTDAPATTTIAAAIRAAMINSGRMHAASANTASSISIVFSRPSRAVTVIIPCYFKTIRYAFPVGVLEADMFTYSSLLGRRRRGARRPSVPSPGTRCKARTAQSAVEKRGSICSDKCVWQADTLYLGHNADSLNQTRYDLSLLSTGGVWRASNDAAAS